MTQYIADTEHYSKVILWIPKVKRLLWIAAADLNDLYVKKSVLSMTAPNRCAYCLTKCRNVVATIGTEVWIRHNRLISPNGLKRLIASDSSALENFFQKNTLTREA